MIVRVAVRFSTEEVALIDRAVAELNKRPGARATRSDVIRLGSLSYAERVLCANNKGAAGDPAAPALPEENT